MSFQQWLRQFKALMGWKSAAGNTVLCRQDWQDGLTPEQAAWRWRNPCQKPALSPAVLENWMRALD
jgi:hypothetical protein